MRKRMTKKLIWSLLSIFLVLLLFFGCVCCNKKVGLLKNNKQEFYTENMEGKARKKTENNKTEVCQRKYRERKAEYDSSNNEYLDGVSYEHEAEIFYSPVLQNCIGWSTYKIYVKEYDHTEIIYDIYNLDKNESLFHDRDDSNNLSEPSTISIQQFLEESTSKKDFLNRIHYYTFGGALE